MILLSKVVPLIHECRYRPSSSQLKGNRLAIEMNATADSIVLFVAVIDKKSQSADIENITEVILMFSHA